MKTGANIQYLSTPTSPTAPTVPIIELDSNGYPTTLVAGTGGYFTTFSIPNMATYSGKWVIKWLGTGTVAPQNFSRTITLSAANRVEFLNTDTGVPYTTCSIFVQAFSNAPNHVTNIRMCRIGDEALMDAGQLVFPDHLALMKSAKPGAIRSLGFGGGFDGVNTALIGLWAQRKPVGYIQYGAYQLNPSFFGGTTTHSGTDYSLTYAGFTLTDKAVVHLIWDAAVVNITSQNATVAWSTTNGSPIVVHRVAHGLTTGNAVAFGNSGLPAGIVVGQQYFVSVIDVDNFNISATSGGALINASVTTSGSWIVAQMPRLNINGAGFINLTDLQTPNPQNVGSICGQSPYAGISTVVYDQTTNWWHISVSGVGLMNGTPPEIFVDYCAAIGANPWMVAPFLTQTTGGALGGITDFMPSWVTYAKNTYPWMKPLIEPYNETWNGSLVGLGTHYASTLAYKLWPAQAGSTFQISESYGKWVSDLGQAISAIYGNDRTKYSQICMGQAVTFHSAVGLNVNDARLTSALYVSVSGGQPAYKWCDRVGAANYIGSSEQGQLSEQQDAFNYYVTNNGNPSAQSTIAESYTANVNNGVDTQFTTTFVQTIFANIKAWSLGQNGTSTVPAPGASGNTVAGIVGYEGGWGPDVPVDSGDASTIIASTTGITQANPCVITLASGNSTTNVDGNINFSGNPGVVGQMVNINFVSGMTQVNNGNPTLAQFTSGTASISCTQTLIANQAVIFTTIPPAPFQPGIPYHVISTGLSGSAFQLSATKGGGAIIPTGNGSNVTTQFGWFITAVGTSTITLELDSTGFSAWTNTSQGQIVWTQTRTYVGTLRLAGVTTNALGTANTQMYVNHFALSSSGFKAEYPSNFIYFGQAGAWAVLSPTVYAPLTPQWNSIVAKNA